MKKLTSWRFDMCIIIDKDTFSPVFSKDSEKHYDFKPVLDWVTKGYGKIVYGGETYNNELKQAHKYTKIFRLLRDAGRAVNISDKEIDEMEDEIKKDLKLKLEEHLKITVTDYDLTNVFNDTHIISIVIVSKCRIVCTHDNGLKKFLKIPNFYPDGVDIPKIYSHRVNRNLLNSDNIADACKPCLKLKKVNIHS